MNTIHNLEDFIKTTNTPCGILTGTFDPTHKNHMLIIAEAFRTQEKLWSILIIPHNWNTAKTPISLTTRVRWLQHSICHFIPELIEKVFVCKDKSLIEAPNTHFDTLLATEWVYRILCSSHQEKIYKWPHIIQVPPPIESYRSSAIKADIKEKSNNEKRIDRLAPQILLDIEKYSIYS